MGGGAGGAGSTAGVGESGTGRPDVDEPDVGEPGLDEPGLDEPGLGEPGLGELGLGELGAVRPGVGRDGGQPPRLLEVGRVARAHGLRGEVVVDLTSDRPERVEPGSVLFAGPAGGGGRRLEVVKASPHGGPPRGPGAVGRWIVAFAGVSDREGAEALHGLVLSAPPLAASGPDTLWVHELVGAEVADRDGRTLGRVAAVEVNPASDLLVLEDGGLVPMRFVVGSGPGRVVVDSPAGLLG